MTHFGYINLLRPYVCFTPHKINYETLLVFYPLKPFHASNVLVVHKRRVTRVPNRGCYFPAKQGTGAPSEAGTDAQFTGKVLKYNTRLF